MTPKKRLTDGPSDKIDILCRAPIPPELNFSRNVWWNKDYTIERDWLCGKPVGQSR